MSVALVIAVAGAILVGRVMVAQAQQGQAASIEVASTMRAEPASKTGWPIKIGPPQLIEKNSFLRIRGLPPVAALSDGHAIAPGVWAVPLNALPSLAIILPAGAHGRSDVVVSLVSMEGKVLAEVKMVLTVVPASAPASLAEKSAPPAAVREPSAPPLSAADRERALGLHAKGQELIERGNIYAARKFFERAVEIGLAQSALALAATYDPDELAKLKVVGLTPEPETARKWYEKARELGAVEAAERLRRLGAR